MPKYSVVVVRSESWYQTVEVEAKSEGAARFKAEESLGNDEDWDLSRSECTIEAVSVERTSD